ncbi:DDE-domain-containing protein [Phanerochaete sordida]|uniref:DDE-domain-containing protein n=1 Tax=Phanerochaete sordida TaxID=48140 RepID=A0A9P3GPW9_9APHY|nr:DDE-domain-containing protein [Phanerochaete sordida]
MTGKALSARAKAAKQRRVKNAKLATAHEVWENEQAKPEGMKKKSVRTIAKECDVSYSTLNRLVKGGRSLSAFNAKKRLLTAEEERTIVEYILESSDRALPPSLAEVELVANAILAARPSAPSDPRTVGKNWVDRFLDTYRDELQTHWCKPLDTVRARSLNPEILKHWMEEIVGGRYHGKFRPEDTYAFDESGFPAEFSRRCRVVGRRGTKTQHKQGTASRENTTVLITICADGTVLKPLIIYKAKNFRAAWAENNVAGASFAYSDKGWTDGEIAAAWLINDFDEQTRDKAAGRPRALFVDGHISHYSKKLLDHATSLGIEIFGYPPHCTHALQGLDVACFGRMKELFQEELRTFEEANGRGINKSDFAGVFGTAFLKAFTQETIAAAFSKTGIHPYNPDAVTPSQTKPSEATSIQAPFPLRAPSPVQAVLSVFESEKPTAFELNPDTYQTAAVPGETPPVTPTRMRRRLVGSLAQSQSGRTLIDNKLITSTFPVFEPTIEPVTPAATPRRRPRVQSELPATLEDARTMIEHQRAVIDSLRENLETKRAAVRRQNAQLLVQCFHLKKINHALRGKESQKKINKRKLFHGGKGRVLTDPEFKQLIAEVEAAKMRKVEARKESLQRRADAKATRASLDLQWARMLEDHAAAVRRWEGECLRLREMGTLVKNLPKKPKKPLKPRLNATSNAPAASREVEVDEDEGSDVEMDDSDAESSAESEDDLMGDDA